MIEKILPSSGSRLRILKVIFENPGINITEIIKKASVSPNLAVGYTDVLVEAEVLKEKRIGGTKKAHIRVVEPNLESELGVKLFGFLETEKRLAFLKRHKSLRKPLREVACLVDGMVDFVLVWGKFLNPDGGKNRKIDLLVVGKPLPDRRRMRLLARAAGNEVNVKTEMPESFIRKLEREYRGVLEQHIIICGEERFLKLVDAYEKGKR